MKNALLAAALLLAALVTQAQSPKSSNYSAFWKLVEQNKFREAQKLFTDGKIEPENAADAYLSNLYLGSYLNQSELTTDFVTAFYERSQNPDPYVYALWFTSPVVGKYGKKTKPHQTQLIRALFRNENTHGTLRAAANYQYGMHYLFQNKFDTAQTYFDQIGGIRNWQYVGTFENLSESGIFKNYGPLEKPDGKAEFLSANHAEIKWFAPEYENMDGWIPFSNQFEAGTGVAYAQTFVTSPSDREVFLNVGATGAIRVWINDAMLISETTERITELDTYTVKCALKKGVNRVLVQLSFTNSGYPNFIVRFTDSKFAPIAGLKGSNAFKPYAKAAQSPVPLKHFAESFFQEKIARHPENIINYLLLADVYLRHEKVIDARNVIEEALTISDNNLLRLKLVRILENEQNETGRLEQLDRIRQADPKAAILMTRDITEHINTERYAEALDMLAEFEKLYGEDLGSLQAKMGIYAKQKRINELVEVAEYISGKYPDEGRMIQLMYAIQKDIYRNKAAAMKVYDDYLRHSYNYDVLMQYIKLLHEEGNTKAVKEKRQWIVQNSPWTTSLLSDLAAYHIQAREFDEADGYLKRALKLSPYHQRLWELVGDVKREQNQKPEAIAAYQRSLEYYPNQYDVIAKLRELQGKPEIHKIIPQVDQKSVLANDVVPDEKLTTDAGYYILLDDETVVLHPGGAVDNYCTFIVRITNENGIDEYKESNIGYSSSQRLFIEQFDLIKKSGATIRGERNQNTIVFTNLEVGDVVVYRYRYQNFNQGRFSNDFWSKWFLQREAYASNLRYTVMLPSNRKLNQVVSNSTLQPTVTNVEDFKKYTWTVSNQAGYKSESYMPALVDIVPVLHISTLNSWNDIATWYADLINKASDETFELNAAFQKIFPKDGPAATTEFEKARRIYQYIQENIRYSSVDFRQSAYRPQTASKTLATRLGDCKDLSNLFMKFCDMAGLQAQMVLTDTRDNGEFDMLLPSLDFNHCISKVSLDGKEYFIELTDDKLPFASLPNSLTGAMILEIPRKAGSDAKPAQLRKLFSATRGRDVSKASLVIRPEGNDLLVDVDRSKHGHLTSQIRTDFFRLPYEKQVLKLHDYIGARDLQIDVDTLVVGDLAGISDSLSFKYRYRIKDLVSDIGSIKTFRLIFPDVVATSNHFVSPQREYPVNYIAYEDTDYYETKIRVEIPSGKKLVEVPSDISLSFGGMDYQLQYAVDDAGALVVKRKFASNRKQVDKKEYPDFKAFLDNIVKAEQRMIAIH